MRGGKWMNGSIKILSEGYKNIDLCVADELSVHHVAWIEPKLWAFLPICCCRLFLWSTPHPAHIPKNDGSLSTTRTVIPLVDPFGKKNGKNWFLFVHNDDQVEQNWREKWKDTQSSGGWRRSLKIFSRYSNKNSTTSSPSHKWEQEESSELIRFFSAICFYL